MTLQHSLILYIHNIILTDQLSRRLSLASTLKTELTVLSQHDYLRNTLHIFTPVQCSFCIFQVEEQTQYGIISSKGSYIFFKRGLPVESKSIHLSETFDCSSAVRGLFLYMLYAAVTAEPMPYGKHTDTPDESKLIPSDGSIGTLMPALQGSSTTAFCQQASSKRSFEDRGDGGELKRADSTLRSSLRDIDPLTLMMLPNLSQLEMATMGLCVSWQMHMFQLSAQKMPFY